MSFQIELLIDPTITDGDYLLEYIESQNRNTILKVDDLEPAQMSIIGLDFKLDAEDLQLSNSAETKRYVQLSDNFIPFQVRERKNFNYGMGETLSETRQRSIDIKKFTSRIKGKYILLIIRDSQQVDFATPIKTVLSSFFGRQSLELTNEQPFVLLAETRGDTKQSNMYNVLVSKAGSRVKWLVQTSSPYINVERWNTNFRFKTSSEVKNSFTDLFEHLENLIGEGSAFRDIIDKLGHHVGDKDRLNEGNNTIQDIQIPRYTTYDEDLAGDSELIRTNLNISAKASQVMGIDQLNEKRQKIMRQSFLSKKAHQLLVQYVKLYDKIKKDISRKLDIQI